MSRLFSMTSSISDATMFSAATMTMRPMVIEIAIFSSHSAENSDRFMSAQSWVDYSAPSVGRDVVGDLPARDRFVDAKLDEVGVILAEQRSATSQVDEARTRESNS